MANKFILDGFQAPDYIQSTDDVRKEQQRLGVEVESARNEPIKGEP